MSNIPFDEFEIPPPLKLTIESLIKMCLSVTQSITGQFPLSVFQS